MANYSRLKTVLIYCKSHPDIWEESTDFHDKKKNRYCFLGIAAMLALGLDPVKGNVLAKMKENLIPSLDIAQEYLELSSFEMALFWSYYRDPCLTLKELEDLISLVCTGKQFEKDGLTITRKDLVLSS
jgi:hypothetical protein